MTYSPFPEASGPKRPSPDAAVPDPERERLLREEVDALRKSRPFEVIVAFRLWLGVIALSMVADLLGIFGVVPDATARQPANVAHLSLSVMSFFVVNGLWLFFVFSMRAGQNWARMVMTVITVLYTIFAVLALVAISVLPAVVRPPRSVFSLIVELVTLVVAVTAVAFMFRSRASDYFEGA